MSKRAATLEPFSKKSKPRTSVPNDSKLMQRRNKLFNSRQIRTSNNDPSFKDGILDVPSFLKSREFEIQQLEKAQLRSQYSASTRSFQSLPRSLRRRTASHNVKRVPKRMRLKAIREMKINHDANNAVGAKSKPHLKGKELYKLKLSKKLLKIAARLKLSKFNLSDGQHSLADYNLRSKIKLITLKIKTIEQQNLDRRIGDAQSEEEIALLKSKVHLNNILGSYDNLGINELLSKPRGLAKYHKRQKNFVWLPTHVWHTKRAHLIKRWGYQIPLAPTQKCYRSTHRKSVIDGGLISDTSYMDSLILETDDMAELTKLLKTLTNGVYKRRANKLWSGALYMKSDEGLQKMVGHATIIHVVQTNAKALIRVHPSIYEDFFQYLKALVSPEGKITLYDCRYSLGSIDLIGPMALSGLARILNPSHDVEDSSKNIEAASKLVQLASLQDLNSVSEGTLMSFYCDDPRLVNRPIKINPNKFKIDPIDLIIELNKGEGLNYQSVSDLFSFNGRTKSYENQPSIKQLSSRRSKSTPGQNKLSKTKDDPSIPILIFKADALRYTLIVPWYWVLPFWIQLNKISHLSIMGLKQIQQLNFESGRFTYPKDYPFLTAGFVENFVEGNELFKKWSRIQPGKRVNYTKLDLKNNDEYFGKGEIAFPFNCDWKFLQLLRNGLKKMESNLGDKGENNLKNKFEVSNWDSFQRQLLTLNDVYEHVKDQVNLEKEKLAHGELVVTKSVELMKQDEGKKDDDILTVTPVNLTLVNKGHPKDNARIYAVPEDELPQWLSMSDNRTLSNKLKHSVNDLSCPTTNYLIGFITSGSFNLSQGAGSGVGYIDLSFKDAKYVLVRNVGESSARLAKVQSVKEI